MTLNVFAPGVDPTFTTKLNDNFGSFKIASIYTGTALNATVNGASQTTTLSYEFSTISSATIGKADYLEVELNGLHICTSFIDAFSRTRVKIETKSATATSFTTSLDTTSMVVAGRDDSATTDAYPISISCPFRHIHTLTASEKTEGVVVKISVTAQTDNDASNNASYTNRQTILKLCA